MNKFYPWRIVYYQTYIFQLEEYDYKRFINSILHNGLFFKKTRKPLVFTSKVKLNILLSTIIKIVLAFVLTYLVNSVITEYLTINLYLQTLIFLITLYLLDIFNFVFAIQAAMLTKPFENLFKKRIIKQAKVKLDTLKDLKIIGITGSYGKTTAKEVLNTILKEKFNVVATMGNNNTPIGIARTILNNVNDKTEIFIVEMGEYYKGDVLEISKLTPPDISVITGINEAHLERYGSMQNAISTKFEIVEGSRDRSLILLNADDELIVNEYKKYLNKDNINNFNEDSIYFFSSNNSKLSSVKSSKIDFNLDNATIEFDLKYKDIDINNITLPFVTNYIIGYVSMALVIADHLGVSKSEFKLSTTLIKPFEHRLEAKRLKDNILLIDDTYNGNSNGFFEGINVLNRFKDRRKVYVTPGIVEAGNLTKEIHLEVGKRLADVADLVILINNSSTPYISEGLINNGFNKDNIIWYEKGDSAYTNLFTHLKPNDVVLMQNDWSDNYF